MLNISNKYITNLGCSNGMLSGLNTQLLNLNFAYLSKRYRLLGLRALASLMIERGPPTEVIYYHFAAKAPNRRGQEGDGAGGGGGGLAWHQLPASHQALLFSYKVNADGWQKTRGCGGRRQAGHARGTETAD